MLKRISSFFLNYYVVKIFLYVVVFITHVRSFTACAVKVNAYNTHVLFFGVTDSPPLTFCLTAVHYLLCAMYIFALRDNEWESNKHNTLVFASYFIGECVKAACSPFCKTLKRNGAGYIIHGLILYERILKCLAFQ